MNYHFKLFLCLLFFIFFGLAGCDKKAESAFNSNHVSKKLIQVNDNDKQEIKKFLDEIINFGFQFKPKDLLNIETQEKIKSFESEKGSALQIPSNTIDTINSPAQSFVTFISVNPELKNFDWDFKVESEEAEKAIVLLTFFNKTNKNTNDPVANRYYRLYLVKQHGDWKIDKLENL